MDRRDGVRASAVAGATVVLPGPAPAASGGKPGDLNVAVIGCGGMGRALINDVLFKRRPLAGLRFRAICDIWPYAQKHGRCLLKSRGHDVSVYEDYRRMLATEKDLDAVIIATPDFMHAEQTIACMEAGLHVYCEQPMAHTVAAARSMVQAMRKTGKLLQIGHQRRSNPCYLYALNKIVKPGVMLGPITTASAQWGHFPRGPRGMPHGRRIDPAVLARYGYGTAHEFRNWCWYSRYSAGLLVRFGTRQIDTWNWFLDTLPTSVIATGGRDHPAEDQWPDNVMAIYEYQGERGTVRASYLMPGRSVRKGHHIELLSGPMGSVTLAESPGRSLYHWPLRCTVQWTRYVYEGTIEEPLTPKPKPKGRASVLDVRGGSDTIPCPFAAEFASPPYQPHLANFFDAIRGKGTLNCPADVAFKSELPVFKTNDAIAAGRKIALTDADYGSGDRA